jgi:HD-GYP domain-containing protein (c-di-GMP phosphodiesterase class II)
MKIRKFRHRYNKLSSRLIFSLTLAILICFGFFTYNVSTTIAQTEIQRFERDSELLKKNISSEVNDLVNEINDANIHFESALMNATSIQEERNSLEARLIDYSKISNSLFIIRSPKHNQIAEQYALDDKNQLIILSPNFSIQGALNAYETMDDYQLQSIYFDKESQKLFTIKKLYQTATHDELLIGIEIENTLLTQYLVNDNTHDGHNNLGNVGITSDDGTFMFHTNPDLIGLSLQELSVDDDFAEELSQAITTNERFQRRIKNGIHQMEAIDHSISFIDASQFTLMYLPVEIEVYDTTWGVVIDVSENVLKKGSINIAKTIIIGGLITLIVLMLMVKFLVSHGLKPIDDLMDVMNEVKNGNLDARTNIASCNEMEIIGSRLNGLLDHMIEDRDSILKQKTEIEELLIEVENLMQENDRIYYETIKSLAKTIDAKDQYTGGHCDRVTEYSLYIGQEMGLKQDELSSLTYGAMLHDIGKIGIAESIITKEGRLTDEEYEAIKSHPEKGFEILKDIHFLKDACLGVLHHHERYDGKGYPHGLKGEEIDKKARIIAIADAFDAMTSDRSYRKALSIEAAIDQLVKNKGIQFDPQMVDIFVKGVHSNLTIQ